MAARFLLISRFPVHPGAAPELIGALGEDARSRVFQAMDGEEVLELRAIDDLADKVLHTLPLPLPCSNYPMVFAPEQFPEANAEIRPSYPFHQTPIPDAAPEHGRKVTRPVTLGDWMQASGTLQVTRSADARSALFEFEFSGLVPDSLYTVMTLRTRDLDPAGPTRPGPLGVPNVFISDTDGRARYRAWLPNPFPQAGSPFGNRVINVVVLWMSYQMSHGGAIGRFGLGGDVHAHLKLRAPAFGNFETIA